MNAERGSGTGSVRRGRRALFTDPAEFDAVPVGERPEDAAHGDDADVGDDGTGRRVRVECSVCGAVTRPRLVEVVGEAVRPFSWWVPVKRHSRWLRCRACGSRAWCRVEWLSALG